MNTSAPHLNDGSYEKLQSDTQLNNAGRKPGGRLESLATQKPAPAYPQDWRYHEA